MNTLQTLYPAPAAFILFLTIHAILWQLGFIKSRGVFLITGLSVVSYLLTAITTSFTYDISILSHLWVSCPLFMFLVMLYLHLYVGIDRSVSVRVLGELVKAKGGEMSLESLRKVYSGEEMIRHRLDLLVEKKWLVKDNGRYSCDTRGRMMAELELLMKRVYSIDISG